MDVDAGHLHRSSDPASRKGGLPQHFFSTGCEALPLDRDCRKGKHGTSGGRAGAAAEWKKHLAGKRKGITMEIEASNILESMSESIDKLNAAAGLLERTVTLLQQREASMNGDVQKIVAA